mmetsp:Transcript_33738/g.79551  ORF Transcript_33738/g.79551 Transcript_33738/m.79551 type:complete len:288 (+) Transcript_33738:698-1561(+)
MTIVAFIGSFFLCFAVAVAVADAVIDTVTVAIPTIVAIEDGSIECLSAATDDQIRSSHRASQPPRVREVGVQDHRTRRAVPALVVGLTVGRRWDRRFCYSRGVPQSIAQARIVDGQRVAPHQDGIVDGSQRVGQPEGFGPRNGKILRRRRRRRGHLVVQPECNLPVDALGVGERDKGPSAGMGSSSMELVHRSRKSVQRLLDQAVYVVPRAWLGNNGVVSINSIRIAAGNGIRDRAGRCSRVLRGRRNGSRGVGGKDNGKEHIDRKTSLPNRSGHDIYSHASLLVWY